MLKPTLEGELVRLRPIEARDAGGFWEIVSDAESRRVTGQTTAFTRAEVDEWCATVSQRDDRIDLAVTAGGSDEFLGQIVLSGIDEARGCADLHLSMRPCTRGRGYGSDAIGLVLGLAFDGLGLHRVGLELLDLNTRAHALYEGMGFLLEGRRRDAFRDGDGWCDSIEMGILEEEYRAGQLD